MRANLENLGVDTGLEKFSFHPNSKEGQCQRMFKLPHNCPHFTCTKVKLKILQARLQQYVDCTSTLIVTVYPDIQVGFRKAEEPEITLLTSAGHRKCKGIPEKHLLLFH